MEHLSEIYLALKKRILELQKQNECDLETELRLDVENCIDLLAEELDIILHKNN